MTNGLGLGDAYDATIRRIKAQKGERSRLGMEALMWISHSERPLNVDEICHALSVEIGSTSINTNNVPSIRIVLDCCQGLTAVDRGSSTIRLIHSTLKEYLSWHAGLFDRPHAKMAETCLTYLNFQGILHLSANFIGDSRSTPLLGYSSLYWGTHMRMEFSDRARYLAIDLLNQYHNHISAELLWKSTVDLCFNSLKPFSALHCVSYFGIAEVAIDLITVNRWDVNQRDSVGWTPLMWAAKYGREAVVKLLLEQKHIQPDAHDTQYGRTALSWAAGGGCDGVVRLFLGRPFVNPGIIGRWRGTPPVISLLFERKYVDPNKPDYRGRTPLSWAAGNGHDRAVGLLLKREDVSPSRPDEDLQTPLWLAAGNGHGGVVKLLLGRGDVSPNWPSNYGRTPISWAARNGHDTVVKLLLEREDISPDSPAKDGRAPLFWAAQSGHHGVVKLLLEREDMNPDWLDEHGRTPLIWAAMNGQGRVVSQLLEREDVSPNTQDKDGQTPLIWATRNGHGRVVSQLLEREDVSPNTQDKDGQTPLMWAAKNRHEGVVSQLLEREDVSPNTQDKYGRTPLLFAAKSGHERILSLLLEREDVCPVGHDRWGHTPISWVSYHGYDGMVRLLRARKMATPSVTYGPRDIIPFDTFHASHAPHL